MYSYRAKIVNAVIADEWLAVPIVVIFPGDLACLRYASQIGPRIYVLPGSDDSLPSSLGLYHVIDARVRKIAFKGVEKAGFCIGSVIRGNHFESLC